MKNKFVLAGLLSFVCTALCATSWAAPAPPVARKCLIELHAKSINGYGRLVIQNLSTKLAFSKQECFERAEEIARSMPATQGLTYDRSNLKTRGNTIVWRNIVAWDFNDAIFFTSSGAVTTYSKGCMAINHDETVDGDKLYWENCELF